MTRSLLVGCVLFVLTWGCQPSTPAVQRGESVATVPADTAAAPDTLSEPSVEAAADVLRAYYRAIDERRYDDAWHLWASGGEASGQTLEAFRAGFANTATSAIEVGPPGDIGAAAGSRYVEIPVRVAASTNDGQRQSFAGTYTLRRSVVDGATAEQRAWRISSAQLRRQ